MEGKLPNNSSLLLKSSSKLIMIEDVEACSPVLGISGATSEPAKAVPNPEFKPEDIIETNRRLCNLLSLKES